MAQKNKVKELVGRGLNSYHTKALQQINRIEKKNKEQNHKISILSNELDNDYLTKTEEGSVVSLEHSKEGMVYLDELQGNTLVNYCTDGSKEMTLNGDIDVEGTFVTTTEGVDNGKIDIMCEGNTLVNLIGGLESTAYAYELEDNVIEFDVRASTSTRWPSCKFYVNQLQLGKTYTIMFNVLRADIGFNVGGTNKGEISTIKKGITSKGFVSFKFTLPTTGEVPYLLPIWTEVTPSSTGEKITITKPIILEGDWTDKPIPQYFEGMKSVGQDDENGHKIEILSQNKNLFRKDLVQKGNISGAKHDFGTEINHPNGYKRTDFIKIKPNTSYCVSMNEDVFRLEKKILFDKNKKAIKEVGNTFNSENALYLRVIFAKKTETEVEVSNEILLQHNIQIEEGNTITTHVEGKQNKKEILLNEPLRGLPNGVKNRIVKIGGKYFIERKIKNYVIDGTESWNLDSGREMENTKYFRTSKFAITDYYINSYNGKEDFFLNDRYTQTSASKNWEKNSDTPSLDVNKDLTISIRDTAQTIEEFKQKLSNNPINLIFEVKPTYEPLEIEPTLNTYNDVTHISNNSIIPCNMKIQNSGYNAIIKPSTLYTVALDTDKSGTIGINLGGAKGTTTNNVLTLTTPATLADDSLRLYGKGIKGSKVRLLEGDKTNWIPSHFEGMKSSFEDKFDATDNTYKMEILSNNKNLFDINGRFVTSNNVLVEKNNDTLIISNESGQANWQQHNIFIRGLQHNKTYLVNIGDLIIQNNFEQMDRYAISIYEETRNLHLSSVFDVNKKQCRFSVPLGARLDKISLRIHITTNSPIVNKITVKNIQISEVDSCIIDRKFNKIQFSSIEPLRSLPSGVKDKFIFKNGKLMIERNTSKTKITSDMNFARSYDGWFNIVFACEVDGLKPIDISTENVYCNILPYFNIAVLCNALGRTGVASHNWINNMNLQIAIKGIDTVDKLREWISERDMEIVYQIEPTYEEVPFELQKIILEGYENGTLFFDTNIPPTSTVTYAGETPIVKSVRLNKTEVSSNTDDINDNIIPYLMDMDYRVVMLQLATEELEGGVSMARLFGGTYEMIKRDILSKRLTREEYGHRLADYFNAGKLTEEQVRELEELR